jgi:hypothetical protein
MRLSLLLLGLLIALALADTCGGANCPTGKCPTCYCGRTSNFLDIAAWCSKHSWSQACCKCIVAYESGGNANALNYNNNGTTYLGLWQINTVSLGRFRCTGRTATRDSPPAVPKRTSPAPCASTRPAPSPPGGFGRPAWPAAADVPCPLPIPTFPIRYIPAWSQRSLLFF